MRGINLLPKVTRLVGVDAGPIQVAWLHLYHVTLLCVQGGAVNPNMGLNHPCKQPQKSEKVQL